jgi:hypothetical protein
MTDAEMFEAVRRLRAAGTPPKAIARALGVRPAVVAPLIRRVAAEVSTVLPGDAPVAGCWVSPGWSRGLTFAPRSDWQDVDVGPDGPEGIAVVVVARVTRGHQLSAACFLVDTFCLGVKATIAPVRLHKRDLPDLLRQYFMAFPMAGVPAPIELAQQLVLGGEAYAKSLGFSSDPDFELARDHLGELREPWVITFGRAGKPMYFQGPHDDPVAVMRTLADAVGSHGFDVEVTLDSDDLAVAGRATGRP